MRSLTVATFIFILIALLGCQGNERIEKLLMDIKEQGNAQPQLAMSRLDSIWHETQNASEYFKYKACLLRCRLRDKMDLTATSVDTIAEVVRFFESKGTESEQAEAYYYLASAYRDLEDYPQAVDNFLKTVECSDTLTPDGVLTLRNAYSQLAFIYSQQSCFTDALQMALNELDLEKKNNMVEPRAIMDVATNYWQLGQQQTAVEYGSEALIKIQEMRMVPQYSDIVAELLFMYAEVKDSARSSMCVRTLNELPVAVRPLNYKPAMALYYETIGNTEEAFRFYKMMQEEKVYWASVRESSRFLSRYYRDCNPQKALLYTDTMRMAYDSVNRIAMLEQTALARGERVYQRNLNAEIKAIKKTATLERIVFACVLVIILVSILGGALYVWRRKKDYEIIIRQQQALKITNDQKNDLMRISLMKRAESVDENILEVFKRAGDGYYTATDSDWKLLLDMVDKEYPDFTEAVHTRVTRLTQSRIYTCYLLKIGLSNAQICRVLDSKRQTIWDRTRNLKEALGDAL